MAWIFLVSVLGRGFWSHVLLKRLNALVTNTECLLSLNPWSHLWGEVVGRAHSLLSTW